MDPRTESAEFAPRPIARRRGGVPVAVGLWALVIGGLVAIGSFDRLTGGSPAPAVAPGSVAPLDEAVVAVDPGPQRPRRTDGPDLLRLDVRRDGRHLFVHGTVLSENVVSIVMSLQDATGRAAKWATVSLPGGSTAFRLGAENRFDTYIRIPDELVGQPTWIQASAYTAIGRRIGTARNAIAGGPTVRHGLAGRDSVGIRPPGEAP